MTVRRHTVQTLAMTGALCLASVVGSTPAGGRDLILPGSSCKSQHFSGSDNQIDYPMAIRLTNENSLGSVSVACPLAHVPNTDDDGDDLVDEIQTVMDVSPGNWVLSSCNLEASSFDGSGVVALPSPTLSRNGGAIQILWQRWLFGFGPMTIKCSVPPLQSIFKLDAYTVPGP